MSKTIDTKIDTEAGILRIHVAGCGDIEVRLSNLSDSNTTHGLFHGIKQRVCDAGALGFNKSLGRYATAQEKFDAMAKIAAHLNSGAEGWEVERGAGAGRNSFLSLAIAEVVGKVGGLELDAVRAELKTLSAAERAALSAIPEVNVVLRRLQSAGIDPERANELLKKF